ncbi:MAG TPA: class I SAM-dependent methyltransferase [Stellaceae bacterium]|nr:class I SAM-dependent methyltransferase [Stellaceae bacterium]
MPYSKPVFDGLAAAIIRATAPRTCLDLGAGAGKYGKLVRRECPACHLTAIESHRDNIARFGLAEIYDTVECADVMSLFDTAIGAEYDLVVAGDLIEHLRKSDGLDLLNFLVYRAAFILLVYPTRFLQGAVDGNRREAHISAWSALDFAWCERTNVVAKSKQEIVVLRGFLPHPVATQDLDRLMAGFAL